MIFMKFSNVDGLKASQLFKIGVNILPKQQKKAVRGNIHFHANKMLILKITVAQKLSKFSMHVLSGRFLFSGFSLLWYEEVN